MSDRRTVTAVAVLLIVLAVGGLRALTMATYRETPTSSRTAVSFEVVTHRSPSGDPANAQAILWPCVADLDSHVVLEETEQGVDGRVRAVLQPALDRTEVDKFRGCLADLRVAHARATDIRIQRLS